MDGDAAVVRRHRDHRVVLDVELLLVADPVLALEDQVGGGERRRRGRPRPARSAAKLVLGDERVEDGGQRLGDRGRGPARGAQRRPVRAPRCSASGSAWCWISPPTGTRIGWSALIELTTLSPGMSAAVTTTTVDQSNAGSSSSAAKRRVRVGRADRRAVPGAGEDQVVGVLRGAGQLGRALAPERGDAPWRDPSDRPGLDDDGRGRLGPASSGRARAVLHGDGL